MARVSNEVGGQQEDEKPEWIPKTEIGRMVKSGQITSVEEIFFMGKKILEHEIVDYLYPNLIEETLEVSSTQRMTDNGRKAQFRAVVLVGDKNGHVGVGVGKSEEVKPAIESAIKNAKRNIISVPLGKTGKYKHTLPIKVVGKSGSVEVTLKPAPLGIGLVANEVVKKVLAAAGVKDIWSFSRGHTRNVYNTAMAVIDAIEKLNTMRLKEGWESIVEVQAKLKSGEKVHS
ncbi:MAG: 30S ribosomal protein S5 [Candidatus Micrarchaeota archaeon]|nr:30S ribosomal protein S5 [Candidatus Micrarchaeota archaeon]